MMSNTIPHIFHINVSWTNKQGARVKRDVILCETSASSAETIAKRKIPEIRIDEKGIPQNAEPMDIKIVTHDLGRAKEHFTLYVSEIVQTSRTKDGMPSELETALIQMAERKGSIVTAVSNDETRKEELEKLKAIDAKTLFAWSTEYMSFYPDKEKDNLPIYDAEEFFLKKLDQYLGSHYTPPNENSQEQILKKQEELKALEEQTEKRMEKQTKQAKENARRIIEDAKAKADSIVKSANAEYESYREKNQNAIKEAQDLVSHIKNAYGELISETKNLLSEFRLQGANEPEKNTEKTDEISETGMELREICMEDRTEEEKERIRKILPEDAQEQNALDITIRIIQNCGGTKSDAKQIFLTIKKDKGLTDYETMVQIAANADDTCINDIIDAFCAQNESPEE